MLLALRGYTQEYVASSSIPDGIVLRRHLDLGRRTGRRYTRRAILGLIVLVPVLGIFNLFGQRPHTETATTKDATLSVYSPTALRGGLLFTARFHIRARTELKRTLLVLDPGWIEDMQVNSITPQPVSSASRNGRIVLDLGHLAAGTSNLTFIEFQVNPTNVGHRSQSIELDDGPQRLLTIKRTITIFP
jgi:hypothetical protein